MAVLYVAAEHGGLIKKEIKKESSWVKLKAFSTNVGQPNKLVQFFYSHGTSADVSSFINWWYNVTPGGTTADKLSPQ